MGLLTLACTRTCIYLRAFNNNSSFSSFEAFMGPPAGGDREYGIPSHTRVGKGGENILTAEFMLLTRGLYRGSVRAGASTRNQRIERFWRDVRRNVSEQFRILADYMIDEMDIDLNSDPWAFVYQRLLMKQLNGRFGVVSSQLEQSQTKHRAPT